MIRFATIAFLLLVCLGCSTDEPISHALTTRTNPESEAVTNTDRPKSGTVESLLEAVEAVPDTTIADAPSEYTLWVPESLTMQGNPVMMDIAMAVVLDKLLGKDFFPDGFEQGDGGRLYKYQREL